MQYPKNVRCRGLVAGALVALTCLIGLAATANGTAAFALSGTGSSGQILYNTLTDAENAGLTGVSSDLMPVLLTSQDTVSSTDVNISYISYVLQQCAGDLQRYGGYPDWLGVLSNHWTGSGGLGNGLGNNQFIYGSGDGFQSLCDPITVMPSLYTATEVASEPWQGEFCAFIHTFDGNGEWWPTSTAGLTDTHWSWLTDAHVQATAIASTSATKGPIYAYPTTASSMLAWLNVACPVSWLQAVYGTQYTNSIAGATTTYTPSGMTSAWVNSYPTLAGSTCNFDVMPATVTSSSTGLASAGDCTWPNQGTAPGQTAMIIGTAGGTTSNQVSTDVLWGSCSGGYPASYTGNNSTTQMCDIVTATGVQFTHHNTTISGQAGTPIVFQFSAAWLISGTWHWYNIASFGTDTNTGVAPTTSSGGPQPNAAVSPASTPPSAQTSTPSITVPSGTKTGALTGPSPTVPTQTGVTNVSDAPDFNSLISGLQGFFGSLDTDLLHGIDGLRSTFDTDITWLRNQLAPLLGDISSAIGGSNGLLTRIATATEAAAEALTNPLHVIVDAVTPVLHVIQDAANGVAHVIVDAVLGVVTVTFDALNLITNPVEAALEWALEPSTSAMNADIDSLTNTWNGSPFGTGYTFFNTLFAALPTSITGDPCGPVFSLPQTTVSGYTTPSFTVYLPSPPPCPGNGPGGTDTTYDTDAYTFFGYHDLVRGLMEFGLLWWFAWSLIGWAPWSEKSASMLAFYNADQAQAAAAEREAEWEARREQSAYNTVFWQMTRRPSLSSTRHD